MRSRRSWPRAGAGGRPAGFRVAMIRAAHERRQELGMGVGDGLSPGGPGRTAGNETRLRVTGSHPFAGAWFWSHPGPPPALHPIAGHRARDSHRPRVPAPALREPLPYPPLTRRGVVGRTASGEPSGSVDRTGADGGRRVEPLPSNRLELDAFPHRGEDRTRLRVQLRDVQAAPEVGRRSTTHPKPVACSPLADVCEGQRGASGGIRTPTACWATGT
jgi:hypothetical protein